MFAIVLCECIVLTVDSYRLSVSSDLRFDSQRDLRDIGARNIKVSFIAFSPVVLDCVSAVSFQNFCIKIVL